MRMDEDNRDLPASVAEIAEVIGRERALYLIGKLPRTGSRAWRVCFYVPKRLPPDHQLVRILGWHDAMRMVRHFGGSIVQAAYGFELLVRWRHREIHRLHRAGWRNAEIAEAIGLSRYRVREVLAGTPPEDTGRQRRESGAQLDGEDNRCMKRTAIR